jgi:inosine-uridine nucleoside N-ribohydrolase
MARPVLIDTDTGVDDALALILALRSPEIAVRGITTVAGNVEVRKCTRNVLKILELVGAKGVAVAQGSSKPLRRILTTAPEVHGNDGLGNAAGTRTVLPTLGNSAPRLMKLLCERFGRRLTIVALGPLTNIARAITAYPKSLRRVGRIVSMGGALRVPGNTGPVAEFNYYVDPEAADIVLNSGIPITMVPLDLTEQIVLMRSELEYRARRRPNAVSRLVMRMTKHYMAYHKETDGFNGGFLHDPIAVGVVIDRGLFSTQRMKVQVETRGILTRGMTVAGFGKTTRQEKGNVEVAVRIDRSRFLSLFPQRLWA